VKATGAGWTRRLHAFRGRLGWYWEEVRACTRLAANRRSAIRLVANTLRFHARNALVPRPPRHPGRPVTYALRLGPRPADVQLRTFSGDLFVLHEIFVSDCYALPSVLSDRVRVVVDLGANVGLTTLYYARRFPEARFVCVEPDPENARLLRANVACLGEQAMVLEAAVSDVAGLATFEATGWSWGRQLTPSRSTAVQVRCLTVPAVLAAAGVSRVDVLKVDIEGAVAGLFGSNNAWLAHVDTIVVELAPDYPVSRFEGDVRPFGLRVFPEGSFLGNVMTLATRLSLPAV